MSLRLKFFSYLSAILLFGALSAQNLYAESAKADEQAGAILFRDQGCAHCHGSSGEGTQKAPSLAGLRNNKDWPPEKITHQILNGGQKMPSFSDSLTDAQIAQLVAYLRAKHRPVPPPALEATP